MVILINTVNAFSDFFFCLILLTPIIVLYQKVTLIWKSHEQYILEEKKMHQVINIGQEITMTKPTL